MKGRVLLVDDNEDFLDSTKDVIEMEDFEVITATSGEEALEIIKTQSFQFILMDIKMPGLNGVETFIRMKQHDPTVNVLMATAYSMEDLMAQALREGAKAVLQKPLDMKMLLTTIRKAVCNAAESVILIADDDRAFCEVVSETLIEEGYRVACAHDGREAIMKAGARAYDVVLLDMRLPDYNGLEVYRKMREMRPGIVAILVSGYGSEMGGMISQALSENAHVFLQKPIDMGILIDLLNRICTDKRNGTYRKPDTAAT